MYHNLHDVIWYVLKHAGGVSEIYYNSSYDGTTGTSDRSPIISGRETDKNQFCSNRNSRLSLRFLPLSVH